MPCAQERRVLNLNAGQVFKWVLGGASPPFDRRAVATAGMAWPESRSASVVEERQTDAGGVFEIDDVERGGL